MNKQTKTMTNLEILKKIFGENTLLSVDVKKAIENQNIRLAQKLNLPYPDVLYRLKQEGGRLDMIREAAERDMVNQDFRRKLRIC